MIPNVWGNHIMYCPVRFELLAGIDSDSQAQTNKFVVEIEHPAISSFSANCGAHIYTSLLRESEKLEI